MDAEDHPLRYLLEVASLEARNVTVDASKIRTEYVHAEYMGAWEGDRDDLTTDMASLCEDIPMR